MDPEEADLWLRQAASYRDRHIQSVVITGGEPFYNPVLLERILQAVADNGLVPAVVSNAFWADSVRSAVLMLQSLPNVRMLGLSTDSYHQKSVPLGNVLNAVQAARELGIHHNLAICTEDERDPGYQDLLRRVQETVDPGLVHSSLVYPAGRAVHLRGQEMWMTEEAPETACTAADYPTVFPDGTLVGCMGIVQGLPRDHPLFLGNLREYPLASLLDAAEQNVALHVLRVWGPGRLMKLLKDAGHAARLPQRFRRRSNCDLCYALMKDADLRTALRNLTDDRKLAEETAQARYFYLNEEGISSGNRDSEPAFCENLGFLMTYRCQVACPHCNVGAGPHRTEAMTEEQLQDWITQASQALGGRIKTVCLTGGEPFCDLERLGRVSIFALSKGMLPTAVTNAFWAETPEKASAVLESLPGLRVISISTDAHHLTQIPLERVENALRAIERLRLYASVAVCTEDITDSRHQALIARLEELIPADRIRVTITTPTGRAAKTLVPSSFPMTDELPNAACSSAHTPVVFPDGRVLACLGAVLGLECRHPLLLGNLHEQSLEEVLEAAERNPVLHILRLWGPGRLWEMLEARGFGERLPRRFVKDSLCSLCYDILSDPVLREASAAMAHEPDLMQTIAWGRQFHLQESQLAEQRHPDEPTFM